MNVPDQIISEVIRRLGDDAKRPGSVLYNGWNTLCPNRGLYIMGFNPGGNPDQINRSVKDSLHDHKLMGDFSSYQDQCWYNKCQEDCKKEGHCGHKLHQKRVRSLAKILGCDNIRDVFAANAIFIRSEKQNDLDEQKRLFDNCWPIHQMFLSIVQPATILCLGNGEESSSFSLLRQKLAPSKMHQGPVKAFMGEILLPDRSSIRSRVIGVRHPSYPWFNPVKDLELYLDHEKAPTELA
jgi:hypothetical protein